MGVLQLDLELQRWHVLREELRFLFGQADAQLLLWGLERKLFLQALTQLWTQLLTQLVRGPVLQLWGQPDLQRAQKKRGFFPFSS